LPRPSSELGTANHRIMSFASSAGLIRPVTFGGFS
jgi:hypothetical protein